MEEGQVLDVLMDVDEAALHLHRIVVSLLCILLINEEEEVSCLVRVVEVDVQNMMARMVKVQDMSSLVRTQCSRSESQPGDEWGHLGHLGPIKIENGSLKPPQCIKLLPKSLRRSIS